MRNPWKGWVILFCWLLFTVDGQVHAQDIANYSDCDVCPGTIHYGPEEVEALIGKETLSMIGKIAYGEEGKIQKRVLLIDLDGVRTHGDGKSDPAGYELKVQATRRESLDTTVIYIWDLRDDSYIQLAGESTPNPPFWKADLYLQAGEDQKIELADSADIAWAKLKESHIHKWVMDGAKEPSWKERFPLSIKSILSKLVDGETP